MLVCCIFSDCTGRLVETFFCLIKNKTLNRESRAGNYRIAALIFNFAASIFSCECQLRMQRKSERLNVQFSRLFFLPLLDEQYKFENDLCDDII